MAKSIACLRYASALLIVFGVLVIPLILYVSFSIHLISGILGFLLSILIFAFCAFWALAFRTQSAPSKMPLLADTADTTPFHEDEAYTREDYWVPPPGFSLEGQVVVVTGGTSGVGKATSAELCKLGATVIITGRSEERVQAAAKQIMDGSPGHGTVKGMTLEMSSLKDVRRFAEAVLKDHSKLNYLVCNAGIAFVAEAPWLSEDGYEMMYATNYLGHFLLVTLFLPALKAAGGDARICAVASNAHWGVDEKDLDKVLPENQRFSLEGVDFPAQLNHYGTTKLPMVLMCFELSRMLRVEKAKVTVIPVTCGRIATAIGTMSRGEDAKIMQGQMGPKDGCQTTLYALFTPELREQSGYFIQPYYTPMHRQMPTLGPTLGVLIFEFVLQTWTWGIYKWLPSPAAHRRDLGTKLYDASMQAVSSEMI